MLSVLKTVCVFLILVVQLIQIVYLAKVNLTGNVNRDKLIFAHTICRHGDRNIHDTYPKDPFKSEQQWPGGFGQLTRIGKQKTFALGQYLRKRYQSLLGNGNYSPRKVYIRATDVDRVLMSAEACLAGLFPPAKDQIWNSKIEWQPIPVHTERQSNDYLLLAKGECDHFKYAMLQYKNTTENEILTKHKQLIKYLEKNSGQSLHTVGQISNLHDILHVEKMHGKILPKWANKIMTPKGDAKQIKWYRDFEHIALEWYRMYTYSPETKMLKSGFLLKEILDRFSDKIQSKLTPNRVLWMYFAHDFTISNLLNALNLFELQQPPFASCLFFELYKADKMPYVKIFYRNTTETNISPLVIPNCGVKCPLTELFELYDDILPTESYGKECELRKGQSISTY